MSGSIVLEFRGKEQPEGTITSAVVWIEIVLKDEGHLRVDVYEFGVEISHLSLPSLKVYSFAGTMVNLHCSWIDVSSCR